MRSQKEVFEKRKKLRKRLKKAVYDHGRVRCKENCSYWLSSAPGEDKCIFNSMRGERDVPQYRGCPDATICSDFTNRYTDEDLENKYLGLVDDQIYLAKNYRDLFILNWFLEPAEPDFWEKLHNFVSSAKKRLIKFFKGD